MLDVQTTIEYLDGIWLVSVTDNLNALQRWEKRFHDGLDANTQAFRLKLISRELGPSASPLGIANRYHSEGASQIDPTILIEHGFKPQPIEFGYRMTMGRENRGGEIRRSFDALPASGEIVTFNQAGLGSTLKVKTVSGPFNRGGAIRFILELESVS